jgi:hypothetical protein
MSRHPLSALLLSALASSAIGLWAGPTLALTPVTPLPAAPVRIAYVTGSARSPVTTVWAAQGNGAEPRRLGIGNQPLVAPDGLSVAASLFGTGANSESGPALAIYFTSPVAPFTALNLATATADPLAWSLDSRYLAVMLQSTGVTNTARSSGLAVVDTTTGAVTTIAQGQIYGASFAQDGSDRIVYGRSASLSPTASVNLYVSQPNGTGTVAFTRDGRSLNPVWGPRYIAFDRERLRRLDAPVYQIWLAAPTGTSARRLTNVRVRSLVSGLVPLAFSANGSRLLAEFEGQDTSEAWTVRVPSGAARRLTVANNSVIGAGISRDGSTVLIDEGSFEEPPSNGRVSTIPFGGGRSKVLVAHGAQSDWNG